MNLGQFVAAKASSGVSSRNRQKKEAFVGSIWSTLWIWTGFAWLSDVIALQIRSPKDAAPEFGCTDYLRKTKSTQYWLSIHLTWEDVCRINYLALLERSLWLSLWLRCLLWARYYTKILQEGQRGLFWPSQTPRWLLAHRQLEWSLSRQPSEYLMASNPPTANTIRLCKLNCNGSHGSKSFQCSWTQRTDLFPNSSESPQTFQTSNVPLQLCTAVNGVPIIQSEF